MQKGAPEDAARPNVYRRDNYSNIQSFYQARPNMYSRAWPNEMKNVVILS